MKHFSQFAGQSIQPGGIVTFELSTDWPVVLRKLHVRPACNAPFFHIERVTLGVDNVEHGPILGDGSLLLGRDIWTPMKRLSIEVMNIDVCNHQLFGHVEGIDYEKRPFMARSRGADDPGAAIDVSLGVLAFEAGRRLAATPVRGVGNPAVIGLGADHLAAFALTKEEEEPAPSAAPPRVLLPEETDPYVIARASMLARGGPDESKKPPSGLIVESGRKLVYGARWDQARISKWRK